MLCRAQFEDWWRSNEGRTEDDGGEDVLPSNDVALNCWRCVTYVVCCEGTISVLEALQT
eukprot:SAG31_NODE_24743_length_475_cov_0.680851_1_plen_58_part_10